MDNEMILLSEYCEKSCAEPDFIWLLESEGLIETRKVDDTTYILASQLNDLDMFSRLHYELSINIEGIDVINNLLSRMRKMEQELAILRRQKDFEPFSIDELFDEF